MRQQRLVQRATIREAVFLETGKAAMHWRAAVKEAPPVATAVVLDGSLLREYQEFGPKPNWSTWSAGLERRFRAVRLPRIDTP